MGPSPLLEYLGFSASPGMQVRYELILQHHIA
jgi:hypothetical protein